MHKPRMVQLCLEFAHGGVNREGCDALEELIQTSPPSAWSVLLETIQLVEDESALRLLGAGPLESFLHLHGAMVIDEVERLAKKDSRFLTALSSVWTDGIETSVRMRIARITGG